MDPQNDDEKPSGAEPSSFTVYCSLGVHRPPLTRTRRSSRAS